MTLWHRPKRIGRRTFILCVLGVVALGATFAFLLQANFFSEAIVVPRDFPSVQAALDHASPGASVVLQAGKGPFLGPLLIETPGVSISSAGGKARLHYEGSDPVITIRSDEVTVRDIVIEGSVIGIRLEEVSDCLIEDIAIEGTPLGIQLVGSYGNHLTNLSVNDGETGIEITSSGGNYLRQIRIEGLAGTGVKLVNASSNSIDAVSVVDAQVGISLEQDSKKNEILSCHLTQCAASGAEILNSTNNILADSVFEHSRIGVSLRSASDNVLNGNRVSHCSLSGIELYKSQRSLLLENTINASQKSGITVVDSGENALMYNAVTDCAGSGITLENANTNLVFGNQLQDNAIGIQGLVTQRNRFLRNVIQKNLLVGIVSTRGQDNLFLSNQLANNPFGIALIEASGNHLLRNAVTDSTEEGVSLLNRCKHNTLQANEIDRNGVGILLASSSQNTIMENTILANEIGLRLFLSGFGTRVEANSVSDNEFGIEIDAELKKEDTILRSADVELLHEGESDSSLIITNNAFYRNRSYDIWNQTENPIFVGGNRWEDPSRPPSGKQGQVSSGVIVPQLAWKGVVAVGTVDSLDQVILGRLLQRALQDNGFKVIDLIGLGEAERLKGALLKRDVDLVWGDPGMLNAEELLSPEFTSFPAIAVQNRLTVVVSPGLASRLASRTISELSHLMREGECNVTFAVPNTVSKAEFKSFASIYALPITEESVSWTKDLDETEILLKVGTVQVGIVNRIEETLSLTGFSPLEDDKNFFIGTQSALILHRDLLARYPEIETIEAELSPLLTTETIHSLASRVRLLHRDPTEVAREFLLKEGLITW